MSLRDTILSYRPVKPIEACGTTLYVRAMTGPEVVSLHQWQQANHERLAFDVFVQVALRCLSDEKGDRLFSDGDADAVAEIPGVEIKRIYEAAADLNGLSAKDVDAAEGN